MAALFIRPDRLPAELHKMLVELGSALTRAELECEGMRAKYEHFAYLNHKRSVAYDKQSKFDEWGDRIRSIEQYDGLARTTVLMGKWAMSAARVFAIDYCEAMVRLRWAANKCLEVRDLRPAIDNKSVRTAIKKIDARIPSLEVIRNAAAHGPGYSLDRPSKKTLTGSEGLDYGLHMPGGILLFSMNGELAIASFQGEVHELAVTPESVDELLALRTEIFSALVVWPHHTGSRQQPFSLS